MIKALLTGAGGFCGRHLARYLEAQGVQVHTLGSRRTSERHHMADPLDRAALSYAVAQAQPDFVFHLAGVVVATNYSHFYEINTLYASNLLYALDVAGLQGCPVLLVGSAAEYGLVKSEQLPITEDVPPQPYNHYGVSKLAQTLMGTTLARQGRPMIMVRPFNIIGPGMPSYLAVQSFAQQIAEIIKGHRQPVIEVGNLTSSRDFITIDQVIYSYWQLVRNTKSYGQIINICSGQETKIDTLLSKMISLSSMAIELRTDPQRIKQIDVPRHFGDNRLLQSLVGNIAQHNIDECLTQIMNELIANI